MTAPAASNESIIYSYLMGTLGLTSAQASGVLGNFQVESSFSPTSSNPGEGAIGLAQWEGGRRTALDQYAAATNGSEQSLATQLGFLKQELTGSESSSLTALRQTTTASQAATVFDQDYERSTTASLPQRVSNAETIFNNVGLLAKGDATPGAPGTFQAGGAVTNGGGVVGTVEGALNGGLDAASNASSLVTDPFDILKSLFADITTVDWWVRVGFILLGFLMVVIGIDHLSGGDLTSSPGPLPEPPATPQLQSSPAVSPTASNPAPASQHHAAKAPVKATPTKSSTSAKVKTARRSIGKDAADVAEVGAA